jgi:ubiquinone/menaquinone biosynthesis C-methylase UbiE
MRFGARGRFARDWNSLGQRNPYGAILTGEVGTLPPWDDEQFFETGRRDADRFIETLSQLVPNVRRRRALDFGCGVGRVTRALAAHFESVTGVDAAPAMIAQARALNANFSNCEFVANPAGDLKQLQTGAFDVVYSRLVLQHVPLRSIGRYIPELIRVLSASGILMFQLPEQLDSPLSKFVTAPVLGGRLKQAIPRVCVYAYRSIKYACLACTSDPHMRMSGLPYAEVQGIIERAHGQLMTAVPDTSHGIASVRGFEYWVTKP